MNSFVSVPFPRWARNTACAHARAPFKAAKRLSSTAVMGATCSESAIQSVFNLVHVLPSLNSSAFDRIYSHSNGVASCAVGVELAAKYSVPGDQHVVSFTNRISLQQAWFNEARTRKPQTFKNDVPFKDPTDHGAKCDFCKWQLYTAADHFGRIELAHAVTGSNLFKYCEPCHGIVLFKHHDPLIFNLEQLSDFMLASQLWFNAAHQQHPNARYPFFIWNCLPRAGASQYHGHGQLMLSYVPLPTQTLLDSQAALYRSVNGAEYHQDLLAAHRDVGLCRSYSDSDGDRAHVFASLAPVKDMELIVLGNSITSKAFVTLLHAALRTLIDKLATQTFNVGILNIEVPSADADCNDVDGVENPPPSTQHLHKGDHAGLDFNTGRPVMARIVNRGKMSSQASDYGCLEVFGGASIGHTDPYTVIGHLDAMMQELGLSQSVTPA